MVGVGRGLANLETALKLGVVDSFTQNLVEGVTDADVVFLATPVQSLGAVAEQSMAHLKSGAIITDGGSVKQAVIDAIEPHLRDDVHFVPGHPIAGTENSGAEAAFATLYCERRCILTPTKRTSEDALECIRRMWQLVGSQVVTMEVGPPGAPRHTIHATSTLREHGDQIAIYELGTGLWELTIEGETQEFEVVAGRKNTLRFKGAR